MRLNVLALVIVLFSSGLCSYEIISHSMRQHLVYIRQETPRSERYDVSVLSSITYNGMISCPIILHSRLKLFHERQSYAVGYKRVTLKLNFFFCFCNSSSITSKTSYVCDGRFHVRLNDSQVVGDHGRICLGQRKVSILFLPTYPKLCNITFCFPSMLCHY